MRQLQQTYSKGELFLAEMPAPALGPGEVLINTRASAISVGTELQMVRLAQKSLLAKARERPDLVRRVLQKVRSEGLAATARQVKARLEDPIPMGYTCAGEVMNVGPEVSDLKAGDRVAAAGVGFATHAELNSIPRMLVTPMPDSVSFEDASFVAIGSIALHGIRRAELQFGDKVAVIGLGLLGLLTVQLAKAAGCEVVGSDPDPVRRRIAESLGCPAAEPSGLPTLVQRHTIGAGVDATIVTASSPSSDIMMSVPEVTRLRGKAVIVGFVGMDFPQKPFYELELDIRFSMSYGPGRYDTSYEEKGRDYPYSLVRWTEGRNMAAFLDAIASGQVDMSKIITHRVEIEEAISTYAALMAGELADPVGVVIQYPEPVQRPTAVHEKVARPHGDSRIGVGVIGTGTYAKGMLIPALERTGHFSPRVFASASGRSAAQVAQNQGGRAVSSAKDVIEAPVVDLVAILTRHDSHADLCIEALAAGKHVFVEKPLALTLEELERVVEAANAAPGILMVGHNRRFSPDVVKLSEEVVREPSVPVQILIRVNAGPMEADHWHRDPEVGGGRWIAEGSHFVDLASAIAGSPPVSVQAVQTSDRGSSARGDAWQVLLGFANDSTASITYSDLGDRGMNKELVEVFADGRCGVIHDFAGCEWYESGKSKRDRHRQDKGHEAQLAALGRTIREGGSPPVSLKDTIAITRATLLATSAKAKAAALDAETGQPVNPALRDLALVEVAK